MPYVENSNYPGDVVVADLLLNEVLLQPIYNYTSNYSLYTLQWSV